MPATDGPTGCATTPRAGPPGDTDGGRSTILAASSVQRYRGVLAAGVPEAFDGDFAPVDELISWDADGFDGVFCGSDTYNLVNTFCHDDNTIGWDRGGAAALAAQGQRHHGRPPWCWPTVRTRCEARPDWPAGPPHPGVRATGQGCLAGVYLRWNTPKGTPNAA